MAKLAFKGTDADMQCRGVQYRLGTTVHYHDNLKLCESGFHLCPQLKHVNVYYNFADSRVFIVQHGANCKYEDNKGVTDQITFLQEITSDTLFYVCESPDYKALMSDNLDGALLLFVYRNDTKSVQYLLNRGADVHHNNDEALRYASVHCHCDIVGLLLEHGADVHAMKDEALLHATCQGNYSVIKLLLKHGSDVHTDADAVLRWASRSGRHEIVKLLLKHGADVHANASAALRLASYNGYDDVVKLLLDHGANCQ